MSFKVATPFDGEHATPKLPQISDGKSLVSPVQSARGSSIREKAAVWALEIRQRLNVKLDEDEDIEEGEINILKQDLIGVMIKALQRDDRYSWTFLCEVLHLVEPYKNLLASRQELFHYVERIHHHIDVHKDRLFDLTVADSLKKVFPKEVSNLSAYARPIKAYCPPTPPKSGAPSPSRKPPPVKVPLLPNGKNPFQLERLDDEIKNDYRPKPMTFGDLRQSIPNVVLEMATREAIWNACLGTTAQATNTDLPGVEEEEEEEVLDTERSEPAPEPRLEKELLKVTKELEDAPAMSGREAVAYFTKCFHTGKINFMYFNIAPNRVYRPYDLVDCAKNKANPEHYVFSTFGVLHVYPKQPAENMTLAEWQKEAVLFNGCFKIPFFKNYLIRKMFKRWYDNIHYQEFADIRHSTAEKMIQAVPSYGAALLQVAKLCQELIHLKLLPNDTDKMYTMIEFENVVNYMNMQAEKVLDRFYRYSKVVVDTTAEESFKKLKHCEEQVKHKTVFSKDSLHLQKKKRQQRETNLDRAKHETSLLGNFITLVDQMVLCHLVKLSRACITKFVQGTMQIGPDAPRDGLFKAFLIFGQSGTLSLNPTNEKFMQVLSDTYSFIPVKLCEAAVPIDGTLQVKMPDDDYPTEAREYHPSPVPSVRTSSRHTSIVSMMRDPKKNRPDRKRSMAGLTTATQSANSMVTSSGTERYSQQEAKPSQQLSIVTESIIHTPDFNRAATPTKSQDLLGQATPDLIKPNQSEEDMVVEGLGFMGQYRPLSKANLQEKLDNDDAYCKAIKVHESLMKEAMEEIDDYCVKNAWLNEIHQFCISWNEDSVLEFDGASGFAMESRLSEIRQWTDRVRNFDKTYTTDNGVFFIDCCGVQDSLVPKLKAIHDELCTFVADKAAELAKKFCNEMNTILKNMRNKDTTIGGFAIYAKNVSNYKKDTLVFQQKLEYIKSLFEVTRMSYRQLNADEEKLEENVMSCWEAFLFQIQDAMEFVNVQTPIIQQNLDDTFQEEGDSGSKAPIFMPVLLTEPDEDYSHSNLPKLEEEAKQLCEKATTGKFLDPKEKPTKILIEMGRLREQFYEIQKQMQQASKWKEAITGGPYDLKFLNQMASQMDIRQELWKYVEVSTHAIREWKTMLFKKLQCRKALDKLIEWQSAAGQMKPHLPQGDEVLANWYKTLTEFKQPLPILHKLSNDALKPRHWKAIFLGMGEPFDAEHQFTVEELLAYNLGSHTQTINAIYSAAVAEFSIEQKLVKIRKLWTDREFKLAKHIPDSVFKRDDGRLGTRGGTSSAKRKRMEKFNKDSSAAGGTKSLDLNYDHLYTIIEVEDLKYLLEDSRVMVEAMLTSPYVADHKQEADFWSTSLAEVEEIIDLWHTCQKKWLYLLKVFEEPEIYKRMERQCLMFESIHNRLTEVMAAVAADGKVMSMLTKQRGEKGYRPLQGERVRDLLITLIAEEEDIMTYLDSMFDKVRAGFPRFYFLSNQELVELLGISRNPRLWKPFVKKCFSGITDMFFDLPAGSSSMNSALDYAINAHKLEVTKLHGVLGEELPLHCRLEAVPNATKWFSNLEISMKTTMHRVMESCVQARLEDGSKQPILLLEELAKFEALQMSQPQAEEIAKQIKHQFSHWILRFPAQCVLTAEAIIWERSVFRALEKQDRRELDIQRSILTTRLDQYIRVLQENACVYMHSNMRTRLHSLLGSLVIQGLYHRDIIGRLLQNKNLSDGAYDWLKVLKYHMEIRSVLRAKTESTDQDTSKPTTAVHRQDRKPSLVHRSIDDFHVQRAMTTVSTGYQFGACMVSQMGSMFAYDQEYLGPTDRMVYTPLTERAHLSLTMAIKSFQCGALLGGPGAGKSDTIKDLAKAFGRHLVTVNCGDELTLPIMNQYLTGMIHSGCWALFDDSDRMTMGLMSVFAQNLDYLSNALRVLDSSSDNQYGIRGQPRFDKKAAPKQGEKKIRRNSLTTLHSLPSSDPDRLKGLAIERQATVPHGFNEEGLITYFEDPWVKERERRHSIEKEIEIKESELYKSMRPPPLFYEHVTQKKKKAKPDYNDLLNVHVTYKPTYIGNVLFNGKLVRANANYGCFMTMNTTNPTSCHIPDNLRLCMRPCALVLPDVKMIIEVRLFSNGVKQYKTIASKLAIFFDLLKTQLPPKEQYDFGLKTIVMVLQTACISLHQEFHRKLELEIKQREKRRAASAASGLSSEGEEPNSRSPISVLDDSFHSEEDCVIQAILHVLTPKMENAEDGTKLKNILRDVFPVSTRPGSGVSRHNPTLIGGIKDQLHQDNLQDTADLIEKIMQLYYAVQMKQAVMLIGPTGSGKSTLHQTLSKALNVLHSKTMEVAYDDELIPERNMAMQYTQKLKILKESEPSSDSTKRPGLWKKVRGLASVNNFTNFVAESVQEEEDFPKIDTEVVFPNSMSPNELFGYYKGKLWQNGLLQVMFANAHFQVESAKYADENWDEKKNKAGIEHPSIIHKWMILDGALNPQFVDSMNTLLDNGRKLSLPNGEQTTLQESTTVIFELTDLTNASPSAITRCTMVHCGHETVNWKSLIDSWSVGAKQRWVITPLSVQILNIVINNIVPPTLKFLAKECTSSLSYGTGRPSKGGSPLAKGIHEVTSFLQILSAILEANFLREDWERKDGSVLGPESSTVGDSRPGTTGTIGTISESTSKRSGRMSSVAKLEELIPNYMTIIKHMFAFAYIWGFGGSLHDSCIAKFDEFARDIMAKASQPIIIPDGGTVFDYFVDCKLGMFIRWSDRQTEKTRNLPANYVIIPEIDRYNYIVDMLLNNNLPVLVTGDPGVGKSSLIQNLVHNKHQFTKVFMSPNLSSSALQSMLLPYLTDSKSSEPMMRPNTTTKSSDKHLYFIEDLNTAATDNVTGSQPPMELLRQMISLQFVYDRQRKVKISTADAAFLATATNPGISGSGYGHTVSATSARVTRLFIVLNMFAHTEEILHSIYTKSVQSWLEEFPTYTVEHHAEFAKAIVQGVIDMYDSVKQKLRPTPANVHYIFTLHDIARVMEGILLMSPRSKAKMKPHRSKKKEPIKKKMSVPANGNPPVELLKSRSNSWHAKNGKNSEDSNFPPMMKVITRLWCHEITRVFGDRIIMDNDVNWFEAILEETVQKNFCTGSTEWHEKMSTILEDNLSQREPTPLDMPITPLDFERENSLTTIGSQLTSRASGLQGTTPTAEELACMIATRTSTMVTEERSGSPNLGKVITAADLQASADDKSAELPGKKEASSKSSAEKMSDGTTGSDEVVVVPPVTPTLGLKPESGDRGKSSKSSKSTNTSKTSKSVKTEESRDNKESTVTIASELAPTTEHGGSDEEEDSDDTDSSESTSDSEDDTLDTESQTTVSKQLQVAKEGPVHLDSRQVSSVTDTRPTTAGESPMIGTGYSSDGSELLRDSRNSTDKSRSSSRLSGKTPTTPGIRRATGGSRAVGPGGKRGVTFKQGLITDLEIERYAGPLLSMEQIKEPDEKLTKFLFSKYILPMHADAYGMSVEKGYVEVTEDQLTEALQTCHTLYIKSTLQKVDLVFFREAVYHTARLSRVLATPRGHAVLLGISYCTGRATLVRLAAHIANCKLFEPKVQVEKEDPRSVVHEHLKKCSRLSAIHGKTIVFLLHEDMGDAAISDVCAFIKEGTCPGLYTEEEISHIATQMTPGQVKTTRIDKIEAAFNKYTSRVRQNLHVVFSLNYNGGYNNHPGKSVYSKLSQFPSLVTLCCHVDVYRPWTHNAHVAVAKHWLSSPSKIVVPWNEQFKNEQTALVATAMAYIHRTSVNAVEKLHSHQRDHHIFFTPLTFMEFAHIFKVISSFIFHEERTKIGKHEAALAKMNVAFESIATYKREVSDLAPKHRAALTEVKDHVDFVEIQREEFIKALDRCKIEEERIEKMMSPLEMLRQEAQAEFDRVNPTYKAAMAALKALNQNDIQEIKSYRAPPSGVILVMDAICLLFREDMSWEAAKGLMMKENFFHELEFYDKDNIPDDIFMDLHKYYALPEFTPEVIKMSSYAASALCAWVRAVYKYAEICRNMKPKIQQLLEAEEELDKAQAILGQKRVEANRIKSDLEHRIQAHRETVKQAKVIEKKIQVIEKRIARASNLMDNMKPQHTLWKSELRKGKSKVRTATADALIAAACVCYHGPLDNGTRTELMSDWLSRSEMGNFDPCLGPGRQVKQISLSAKLETLMKPAQSISDSFQSTVLGEGYLHGGDDAFSMLEAERASSSSSVPQKHNPSVYEASTTYRAETRPDIVGDGTESIEANSTSSKNLLATRDNFELQDVLSTSEELSDWTLKGRPADVHSIHNALIMRVCAYNRKHCWPLLVDPDNQAELWVRTLQESSCIIRDIESGDYQFGRETDQPPIEWAKLTEEQRLALQSRGTEKTTASEFQSECESESFSNMDDSTIIMDSGESCPTTTRNTRLGMHSGKTRSTDSFRPVTSVMHPMTRVESVIEDSIERPEHNLWVVPSDDPEVNHRLLNAIIHGVTILITDLERRPLDPLFRGLLLKQFNIDKDGQRVIRIGDVEFKYHKDFKLFLSTSMPIFMRGEGIAQLPIEKMSVIDMATSQEGIVDMLLTDLMRVERPEFGGQKKSIGADLVHHKQEIIRENEVIMQNTLHMNTPLLEDKSLLDALINCQKNVDRNKMILDESKYMEKHLEEKRVHYVPVANHGAKLFEIIQRVAVLSPYYHLTLKEFYQLYSDTIQSRHRGKGSTGSPKARAQELINATTQVVYKYTSSMLFEQHKKLFDLLITLERLRMAQKLSNQELGLFVNGVDTSEIEDNIVFDEKPEWLTNKIWLDCAALETTLTRFRGLRDALNQHQRDWQEYFQCPVDLMNPLPGEWMANFSAFEKVLLWRICAPNRMWEVSQALVLHEMGGVIQACENFNIGDVYGYCNRSTPCVLMLPSSLCDHFAQDKMYIENVQGHTFTNPTREILQFAKDTGMEGRVHVVTCGVSTQMQELHHAMEDCLQAGYWLVIQNAHLAQQWPQHTLQLLKTIVHCKTVVGSCDEELDPSHDSISEQTEVQSTMTRMSGPDEAVHKDFRLWVTTRVDNGRLVPGLLIQSGFKVSCELVHNFSDTMKRTYINAEKMLNKRDGGMLSVRKIFGQTNHIVPMALLHSVLVHRQTFGRGTFSQQNFWSMGDLSAALEQFIVILSLCQRHKGIPQIFGQIYSGHCTDLQDKRVVEAIAQALLLPPKALNQIPSSTQGVASILSSLMPSSQRESLESKLGAICDMSPHNLSLATNVESEYIQRRSRGLLDDLLRVVGAPDLIEVPLDFSYRKADILLQDIYHATLAFPELPTTNPDGFYPLEQFFHSEVQIFSQLLGRLKQDIEYLLRVAQGELPSTPSVQKLLVSISHHQVPPQWEHYSFPTDTPLALWVVNLRRRLEMLKTYIEGDETAVSFNLAVFNRPDRFIHSVLQEFVRREFKDLHSCKLDAQLLPVECKPSSPPTRGAYLTGLQLHNASWDSTRSVLKEQLEPGQTSAQMPVIWLKPIDKYELEKKRAEVRHSLYDCPIYISPRSQCLEWKNIVGTLELPSVKKLNIWAQKRVFISCSLPN